MIKLAKMILCDELKTDDLFHKVQFSPDVYLGCNMH